MVILSVDGDEATGWRPGQPTAFADTRANEGSPKFSADGHWLSYTSNASGRNEIYVAPFPGTSANARQVSNEGGSAPWWSPTRQELVYLTPDRHLMVVPYATSGTSFQPDKAHRWSDVPLPTTTFALHPDGERIAVAPNVDIARPPEKLVVITNFFDEIRRLAPPAR